MVAVNKLLLTESEELSSCNQVGSFNSTSGAESPARTAYGSGIFGSHLNQEHGPWRDFHVVPKLEVQEEGYRLCHGDVPVDLETYVGDGLSW